MTDDGDSKVRIRELTDTSRNKRQAAVFLSEIARERGDSATKKCAQSDKLIKKSKALHQKAKELRQRHTG